MRDDKADSPAPAAPAPESAPGPEGSRPVNLYLHSSFLRDVDRVCDKARAGGRPCSRSAVIARAWRQAAILRHDALSDWSPVTLAVTMLKRGFPRAEVEAILRQAVRTATERIHRAAEEG